VHSAQRPAPPLRMPASAPADVTVRSPAWVDADAPVIAAPAIAAEGALRPAERWVVCASAINEVVQQLPHSPFTALQFCSLVTRYATRPTPPPSLPHLLQVCWLLASPPCHRWLQWPPHTRAHAG
jgi:hypothetical protein